MRRFIDIIFSSLLLFISLPLICIISLLVKITSKGPVLYWSERIGINNKIFLMPKFRTMKVNTPQLATHLLTNSEDYLSFPGKFLRKTSLDELPQLWSVLKGDMSFIGPRPALFNQDDLIHLRTKKGIHLLVPGITGWAQVNGRDSASIPEKVELDFYYLNNKSIQLDLLILTKTFSKVVFQSDISH